MIVSHFDAAWYGRAGAWIGGLLLLIMALTGRQVAVVSVVAVIGLIVGTGLLLYSIPGGRIDDSNHRRTVTRQQVLDPSDTPDSGEERDWR
jgi:hypothetical protein